MSRQIEHSRFGVLFNDEKANTLGFTKKTFIEFCKEWEKVTNEIKEKLKQKEI